MTRYQQNNDPSHEEMKMRTRALFLDQRVESDILSLLTGMFSFIHALGKYSLRPYCVPACGGGLSSGGGRALK